MDTLQRAERRLSLCLMEVRPGESAAAIEDLPPADAAAILRDTSPETAGRVLEWMVAGKAAEILRHLPAEESGPWLATLSARAVAAILRRVPQDARARVIEELPPSSGTYVQRLLQFPDGSAGALMDPQVLTLPDDLNVAGARTRVMEHPSEVHYNVYVVERDGTLAGVLNLRELFASPEDAPLRSVMHEATYRISADAGRLDVVAHPGWKQVHSLPVVDDEGRFLGAIRFRTLRELEEEMFRRSPEGDASTGKALGDLYWTGLSGMAEAFVTALASERGEARRQESE